MKNDVMILVTGLQYDAGQSDSVEIASPGKYRFQNGKHYILYEEVAEDYTSKNMLKISGKKVELTKKGDAAVQMIFEPGKKYMTYYRTPFGNLLIGLRTSKVKLVEDEDYLGVHIDYALDINYTHAADCTIKIRVHSSTKKAKQEQEHLRIDKRKTKTTPK